MEQLLDFKTVFFWFAIVATVLTLARLALSAYFLVRGATLARWLNQHPYIWDKVERAKAKALAGDGAKEALSGMSAQEQRYFLEFLYISDKSAMQWRHIVITLFFLIVMYGLYFFV
ncbi:hypothetical protein [Xanthomonas arboricola]|uniref:hypothetical protein n=1 Tax=Xanthomonas TaxID=338 RepID=UPI00069E037D|nr:hypothetical protein [Xanthomonas arboricola]KOB15807.1 hypothetical protein AE925_16695 [Xanthomonas arboricola]KOB42471.1 hypothetical protein AE931_16965 [Xanthomonas arboricola]